MKIRFRILLNLLAAMCCQILLSGHAQAQLWLPVDQENVTVCPASAADIGPPSKNAPRCRTVTMWEIDPQNDHIWVLLEFPVKRLPDATPLGLFIFAKAASSVYLNGTKIGENGRPADTQDDELAGRMDVVFPIEASGLRIGENRIALRLSSHHGVFALYAPIHAIFIGRYQRPQNATLRAYWPSLLPFGAFVLGALYFLTMAIAGRDRQNSALLSVASVLVSIQLFAETSRGLFAYTYPWHDIRLATIALCSAGFGLSLCAYVVWRFQNRRKLYWLGSASMLTLVIMLSVSGFDLKTSLALLVPTLVAALAAVLAYRSQPRSAFIFGISLLLFAAINIVGAGRFLDSYFYYFVAGLLIFLFVQQALFLLHEEQLRRQEEARASQLQFALDQRHDQDAARELTLKSTGKIQRVKLSDIAYIQAAGDYAEIILANGHTYLHHSTLQDLETELPSSFLRVHRSFLVNSQMIARLERKSSGTGELVLSTDQIVPVSRRIMPQVRAVLS